MEDIKANKIDVNTYSNFEEIIKKNVELDVSIYFDKQYLSN